MGSCELLMVNLFQDMVRLSLVAFALACAILAFLTLRLKLNDKTSSELTLEKGGWKLRWFKIGPFFVFVAMSVASLWFACNLTIPRQEPSQPYEMSTSYRMVSPEQYSIHIAPPNVPTRPDDNPHGNLRGR